MKKKNKIKLKLKLLKHDYRFILRFEWNILNLFIHVDANRVFESIFFCTDENDFLNKRRALRKKCHLLWLTEYMDGWVMKVCLSRL